MIKVPDGFSQDIAIFSPKELVNLAFDFASNASAKNTKRTYAFGWRSFIEWCKIYKVDPLTTENKEALISFYISDKASKGSLRISSISCYLAAIRYHYQENGVIINGHHPSIQKVIKGVRHTLVKRPVRKEPILTDELKEMVRNIPKEKEGSVYLAGLRDRALLLLGFSGAFRRSELVSLDFEDLTFTRDGFIILLRKSKTDQEGERSEKAIPYGASSITCPVRAMQDWLEASQIQNGPIFRPINRHGHMLSKRLTGHAVALIVKRNHIDREDNISGHSLRAGFVTSAAKKRVPEHLIMQQTGHKCSDTLKRYIRLATCFEENAASLIGL